MNTRIGSGLQTMIRMLRVSSRGRAYICMALLAESIYFVGSASEASPRFRLNGSTTPYEADTSVAP